MEAPEAIGCTNDWGTHGVRKTPAGSALLEATPEESLPNSGQSKAGAGGAASAEPRWKAPRTRLRTEINEGRRCDHEGATVGPRTPLTTERPGACVPDLRNTRPGPAPAERGYPRLCSTTGTRSPSDNQ